MQTLRIYIKIIQKLISKLHLPDRLKNFRNQKPHIITNIQIKEKANNSKHISRKYAKQLDFAYG